MMFSRITKRQKIGRMIGKNAVMKVLLNRDTFVSLWRTPQPQVRVLEEGNNFHEFKNFLVFKL